MLLPPLEANDFTEEEFYTSARPAAASHALVCEPSAFEWRRGLKSFGSMAAIHEHDVHCLYRTFPAF